MIVLTLLIEKYVLVFKVCHVAECNHNNTCTVYTVPTLVNIAVQ